MFARYPEPVKPTAARFRGGSSRQALWGSAATEAHMRRGWFPLVPVLALGFGVAGCAGPFTPPASTPPPRDILAWRGATAGELEQG